MSTDETYIGEQAPVECPNCGRVGVILGVEETPHDTLPIKLPLNRCFDCGFTYTDWRAEDVETAYLAQQADQPRSAPIHARGGSVDARASLPAGEGEAQADPIMRAGYDALADGIAQAAKKAGIYNGEVSLSGPQLLLLCDELADAATPSTPATHCPKCDSRDVTVHDKGVLYGNKGVTCKDCNTYTEERPIEAAPLLQKPPAPDAE